MAAARLAGRSRQLPSPAKSSSSALWVSYTGTTPPSPASSPAGFVSFNHSSAAVAITVRQRGKRVYHARIGGSVVRYFCKFDPTTYRSPHTQRPQEAAPSMPLPPSQSAARPSAVARPANLPGLSKEDLILLRAGQRVQHQVRNI